MTEEEFREIESMAKDLTSELAASRENMDFVRETPYEGYAVVTKGHKYLAIMDDGKHFKTSQGEKIKLSVGREWVYDLTSLFGEGDEPTTIEDFIPRFQNLFNNDNK